MSGTRTCPATATTQQACSNTPNAVWVENKCVCCNTGTHYANATSPNNPCVACGPNARCGDGNGYCSGTTTSPNLQCVQDPTTQKYEAVCKPGTCSGNCTGSCGAIAEWFAFSKCTQDPNTSTNSCKASISQWKSWLVYAGIFLLLLIIIIIVSVSRRSSPKVIVPSYAPVYVASRTTTA